MVLLRLMVVLLGGVVGRSGADREHKVHNIVLYPDRHSWCKTTAIKQEVASPGYESVTIDNNVCVGACYSYSIPKTQPAEPGELITPYCDSCQPTGTQCYHVTLKSDGKTPDLPKINQKRVEIITACSCTSCDTAPKKDCELSDENTPELPPNLYKILHPVDIKTILETKPFTFEEIPELLNFTPKNVTFNFDLNNPNMTQEQKYELNSKLITLLKSIQSEGEGSPNLSYDKEELKELLKIIEGSENKLSDKNLLDFINFVNVNNSEDLELDLTKLKEVLEAFRKEEELIERHRSFGLGLQTGGVIHPNSLEVEGVERVGVVEGVGHHHLGEPQRVGLDVGHLIRGPHGSLAFAPDTNKVEEKLNLEADLVKPNQEGVVVSYENHPKTSEE